MLAIDLNDWPNSRHYRSFAVESGARGVFFSGSLVPQVTRRGDQMEIELRRGASFGEIELRRGS